LTRSLTSIRLWSKLSVYEGNSTIRQAGGLDKDTREYRALVQYRGAYIFRMLRWLVGDENFDKLVLDTFSSSRNAPVSTIRLKCSHRNRWRRSELLFRPMAKRNRGSGIQGRVHDFPSEGRLHGARHCEAGP
jgi:hypothetical protein